LEVADRPGRRPDVVLADYHLDSGTGIDVVRKLRARFDPELPAALVTADRSRALKRLADADGLEVVNKPVKPAVLRALIAQIGVRRVAAE
jgi:CheY-like chemotaxis protein